MFEAILIIIMIFGLFFRALIEFMKESIKGRYVLLIIKHNLIFPHRLYLLAVLILSVAIIFSAVYCLDENSKLYTVLLSTGLSVLAGIVVAVYSELKGSSSDKRNQLLNDIVDFSYAVNNLIIDVEYRCDSDKNLAAQYLKIVAWRRSLREKYHEIRTMVKPTPSFSDSDDEIVDEISDRISEAYFNKDTIPSYERDSIHDSILDSLYRMQQQLGMCKSHVKDDAEVASKPL